MLELLEYIYCFCCHNVIYIVTCLAVLFYLCAIRKPKYLPPGPRTLFPIIGNIPDLIGKDVIEVFKNLRKTHGDVFSLYVGNQLIIVLNGYNTIKEALVKNGKYFNGRPKNRILTGPEGETGIIFSCGEFWKEQRKFVVSGLQKLALSSSAMEDRISAEVEYLLEQLAEKGSEPFDLKDMITASIANVIFGIVASKRFTYDDEKFLLYQKRVDENAKLIGNVSVIVNCFPWLRFIPFDPFQMKTPVKNAETIKSMIYSQVCDEHIAAFNENNMGDLIDLYVHEMKKHQGEHSSYNYRQLLAVFGDLLGAGSETSATTIRWAIIYLINYPDIQMKLRSDIINNIGKDTLPRMSNLKQVPYVEAFILEVIRIANVAPLAVPHAVESDSDVSFQGYTIPKNCNLIINLESVFKDPGLFENPDAFRPERFLGTDGNVDKPLEFIPFGIGRRLCAGEMVAKMELFLFISALIQNFEFSSVSALELPSLSGELGITYKPKDFCVRISKVA